MKFVISAVIVASKSKGARLLKYDLKTGEEVYRRWVGDDPNQVTIDDILGGTK